MDAVVTSTEMGIPLMNGANWTTTQIPSTTNSMVLTPPPEASGFPPAYPYSIPSWNYGLAPVTSSVAPTTLQSSAADSYLYGSSLEDSPLSSPGSTDSNLALQQEPPVTDDMVYAHSQNLTTSTKSHSPLCDNVYTQASTMFSSGFEPIMTSSSFSTSILPSMENKNGIDFGIHMQKEVKMPQSKHRTPQLLLH